MGDRETRAQFVSGQAREIRDNFRTEVNPHVALEDSWKGTTSFVLSPPVDVQISATAARLAQAQGAGGTGARSSTDTSSRSRQPVAAQGSRSGQPEAAQGSRQTEASGSGFRPGDEDSRAQPRRRRRPGNQ